MSSNWSQSTQQRASGWLSSIPGYSGYKDKERRRDADKQVREKVAAALSTQAGRVDQIGRSLASERKLAAIGPVDALSKLLAHLVDRIATATYGYGGIFSDRPIDERALDQIRLFDESLFASVESFATPLGTLEADFASGADLKASVDAVTEAARKLGAQLDLRGQIIETGQPAPEAQVSAALDVLKTPEAQKAETAPPPAFELQERDALAILGDNFLVDSRIDVEAATTAFRLFRVDTVPDRWLSVPKRPGQPFALLTTSNDPFSESPPAIGGSVYAIDATGSGTSEIAGAGGKSDRIGVTYWLLTSAADASKRAVVLKWSGTSQVMTGSEVHPDDVELFGASKPS